MKVLLFTIEGVLQSWGERSSWDTRDSAEWPTKSGIIGMISAAIGYGYGDKRIGELCNSVSFGAKTKKRYAPMLNDFQTVDYNHGLCADGSSAVSAGQTRIVQHKHYIMDKKFLIAISGETETLQMMERAMLAPKWAMHLGRACCPPSRPIIPYIAEFESIEEALENTPLYTTDRMGRPIEEVMQIESSSGERRTDTRAAVEGKHYWERFVQTKAVQNVHNSI